MMKLEVFEYLIAIEKYGSLNKAARSLYVSQPNLSQMIKNLEAELGYVLIRRNHRGITFTEEGKQVLQIGHEILLEREKLLQIHKDHRKIKLTISIGNGNFALLPLCELINEQELQDELDMTILNCAVWDAISGVYEQTIDLAYFIIPVSMIEQVRQYAQMHQLRLYEIKEMICAISVRKGHPLLRNYSKERLWNFVFVDFINQSQQAYGSFQQYINPKKIVKIDHHSLRNEILENTDAYTIGIGNRETEQIKTIPIPELKMAVCELRLQKEIKNPLFNQLRSKIEEILIG